MAQDPSKMTRNPRGSTFSTGMSSASDTEHLRQQIADTRAGMTETIDAIQDRVNPRSVMHRAKQSLKDSTVGRMRNLTQSWRMRNLSPACGNAAGYVMARTAKTRERVMRITRQNPVPTAVVSAAAVFLMVRAMRNRRRRHSYLYEEAL